MTDINVNALAEIVNEKVDLDCRNVDIVSGADVVIEYQNPAADNSYTWYRKYKSGWIEQGGYIETTLSATNTTYSWNVSFPKEMIDTNYEYSLEKNSSFIYYVNGGAENLSTTGMDGFFLTTSGTTPRTLRITWSIKGKSA